MANFGYSDVEKDFLVIPKDTLIYRCAPVLDGNSRYCNETGKTGLYFSTYPLQSLAMCIEYNKDMNLGVYKLKKDVKVIRGKYSHKKLDKKYYRNCFGFSKRCKVRETENISHFDPEIYCMDLSIKYEINLMCGWLKNTKKDGELFLSENDLQFIEKLDEYHVPVEYLLNVLHYEDYKPYSEKYFEHCRKISKSN